jgi:hypothetical protein
MKKRLPRWLRFLIGTLVTLILLTLIFLSNPAHADTGFTLVLDNGDHRPVSAISAREDGTLAYFTKGATGPKQIDCNRIKKIEQPHSISAKWGGFYGVAGTLLGVAVGVVFPPVGIIGGAILGGTTSGVGYLSANATKPKNVTGVYCRGPHKALIADTASPIQ